MGLLEEIARRAQMLPPALAFPDWVPPVPPAEEENRLPRFSDLPQTMLPPHMRTRAGVVDANAPAIQAAIGNIPAGPAIPPNFRVHTGAGVLPPGVAAGAGMPMMEPLDTAPPPPAPGIPVPRERPVEATPPVVAEAPVTDVGARARAPGLPLQIAPPVAPQLAPQLDATASASPAAGMLPGAGGILDRIRTTLGDNSNTLLALGAGFAGAPNIGQGISRAAAAAIPARAADINQSLARQNRGVTTKALIDAGVPMQQAIAASTDPELKKALIKNYIEDRAGKIVEMGQDRDGRKVMGTFDPYTKELKPINVDALTGQPASAAGDADVTGPEYLSRLRETDPSYARQVEAIINGDAPIPTGKTALTPRGARLVKDVLTVEPGVSASDFTNRQAVKKDYTSGISSRVNKAVNTAVTHGAGLEKAIGDLKNFSTMPGILNPVTGVIKKQYDKDYQKARKEFEVNAENYVRELDFAISGGRPTVSGAAHQRSAFDINASPEENMASLRKSIELLKGRLDSQAEGYNKGMRTQREPMDFIDPVNVTAYKKLLGETDGHAAAPATAAKKSAAPKPGTYVWDAATGQLVPAK